MIMKLTALEGYYNIWVPFGWRFKAENRVKFSFFYIFIILEQEVWIDIAYWRIEVLSTQRIGIWFRFMWNLHIILICTLQNFLLSLTALLLSFLSRSNSYCNGHVYSYQWWLVKHLSRDNVQFQTTDSWLPMRLLI